MDFEDRIDTILEKFSQDVEPILAEGMILNVNTMVSNAIKVPEGDYIVALVDADSCKLVSKEAGSETFDVFRHTLEGFFNPEVHTRQVAPTDRPIVEDN